MSDEKVIAYLGPSLPLYRAVELAPNVIFRPPAKQGDILSDAVEIQPDCILLIDGEFLQALSPWHKEIIFCLTKGIKVCGAASMGALRAADLHRQGMIGSGKVFDLYRAGITEDDSEVALLYSLDPKGVYHALTVTIVDIRATLFHYGDMLTISTDHQEALIAAAKAIHFRVRTPQVLSHAWVPILGQNIAAFLVDNLVSQKCIDAEYLLGHYQQLEPDRASLLPDEQNLSKFFWAQYDRDRKVNIAGTRVAQQHIEGHIALSSIDQHQIFWDSKNFHLAHMLAEKLGVQVTEDEVRHEQFRFYGRHALSNQEEADAWVRENNLTSGEFMILIIRMATVRKLHHWLMSTLVPLESTKITLDYLKMHNSYSYWAKECGQQEAKLQAKHVDDSLTINAGEPMEIQLANHCQRSGQTIDGAVEDYVVESGFANRYELMVALERLKHLE